MRWARQPERQIETRILRGPQHAADLKLPAWLRPFLQSLQAIVAGSRDHTLADAPDLDHTMAAEILFLIESLEKAGK